MFILTNLIDLICLIHKKFLTLLLNLRLLNLPVNGQTFCLFVSWNFLEIDMIIKDVTSPRLR